MPIPTRLKENYHRLQRKAQELPIWFRWLDSDAPTVAEEYRLMLKRMWLYWLPALFILAAFVVLSGNMTLFPDLNRFMASIGIGGFGVIAFLLPGLGLGHIGLVAYRWHRSQAKAPSRRMIFFIAFSLTVCVVYLLAAGVLLAISAIIAMQNIPA